MTDEFTTNLTTKTPATKPTKPNRLKNTISHGFIPKICSTTILLEICFMTLVLLVMILNNYGQMQINTKHLALD